VAHYTGGYVNEMAAVGQYRIHGIVKTLACDKYRDLETRLGVTQGYWN